MFHMEQCNAPGCVNPAHAKGLCPTHYGRMKARGSFEAERPRGTIEERFWPKVEVRSAGECWEWKNWRGKWYPTLWDGKQAVPAHRISYQIHNGPIPQGLVVMHSCDNPRCVNPAHLSVGTHRDNALDKVAKQRHRPVSPHGTASGLAKLSEETVLRIRADEGTSKQLASQYGVSATTIWLIRNRRTWRHI